MIFQLEKCKEGLEYENFLNTLQNHADRSSK
jgi:hypothetical protein